jgi:hypothetical protein
MHVDVILLTIVFQAKPGIGLFDVGEWGFGLNFFNGGHL